MKSLLSKLLFAAALSTALAGGAMAADEPAAPAATADKPAAPANAAAPAAPADKAAPAAGDAKGAVPAEPAAAGASMKPYDRVMATEVGKLKNPYTGNAEAIAEGKKFYMGLSCNGCHGGGGGGGMCPPLTNETWVYGGDDDTLFRLIILGTKEFTSTTGRGRKGQEGVVGPMPPYKDLIDDEVKVWKIIAWLRTIWTGRKEKATW